MIELIKKLWKWLTGLFRKKVMVAPYKKPLQCHHKMILRPFGNCRPIKPIKTARGYLIIK